MKKMSTVFVIDYTNEKAIALNEVRKENKWVLEGEGVATIKFDGTACMVLNNKLYKRWDRKLTKKHFQKMIRAKKKGLKFNADVSMFKPLKEGAIACNESFDPITLHWPHWVPVTECAADQYHLEALNSMTDLEDGTYELVGPKLQGNPYNLDQHELWKHGSNPIEIKDYSFEGLKKVILSLSQEGLVWHHPDGRKAKLRKSDFGIDWKDEL